MRTQRASSRSLRSTINRWNVPMLVQFPAPDMRMQYHRFALIAIQRLALLHLMKQSSAAVVIKTTFINLINAITIAKPPHFDAMRWIRAGRRLQFP